MAGTTGALRGLHVEVYKMYNDEMTGADFWKIRQRLGMTQKALAERMAVTPTTLARWERDEAPIRESVARFLRLIEKVEGRKSKRRK